jgi:hypothetical protein
MAAAYTCKIVNLTSLTHDFLPRSPEQVRYIPPHPPPRPKSAAALYTSAIGEQEILNEEPFSSCHILLVLFWPCLLQSTYRNMEG